MGGTYIRSVHSEVGLAFKQALREGRVAMNPCELATPPNNDSQPRKAMNAEQLKAFEGQLDLADEHDFAYWLAVTPGLRRGEVCGLSWGDVDWGTVEGNHHPFGLLVDLQNDNPGLPGNKNSETQANMYA